MEAVRYSDQQRLVTPGNTEIIKMLKVPNRMNYILKRYYAKPLSFQAKQDLIVTLKADSKILFQYGKYVPDSSDPFPEETRTSNTGGLLYTEISSTTGLGRGDNFYNFDSNIIMQINENAVISFEVKNQSAVYKHGIIVSISGFFVAKG